MIQVKELSVSVFVLAFLYQAAASTLTRTSHSSVSFVGDDVSFSCTTNRSVPIRWLRSSTGVPLSVYNGYSVSEIFASRFEVTVSKTNESQTTSTLTIRRTQLTDAGTFTCQEFVYDVDTVSSGSSVNLSAFDPKCTTKPSLTNDRQSMDVLAIICEVGYNGSATAPNITCLPVVPREAVSTSDTDNLVTYVKTIYDMENINTSVFSCSMSTILDGAVFTREIWGSSNGQLMDQPAICVDIYTTWITVASMPVLMAIGFGIGLCCNRRRKFSADMKDVEENGLQGNAEGAGMYATDCEEQGAASKQLVDDEADTQMNVDEEYENLGTMTRALPLSSNVTEHDEMYARDRYVPTRSQRYI